MHCYRSCPVDFNCLEDTSKKFETHAKSSKEFDTNSKTILYSGIVSTLVVSLFRAIVIVLLSITF